MNKNKGKKRGRNEMTNELDDGRRRSKRLRILEAKESGDDAEVQRLCEQIKVLPLHSHRELPHNPPAEPEKTAELSDDDIEGDMDDGECQSYSRILDKCHIQYEAKETAETDHVWNSYATRWTAKLMWNPMVHSFCSREPETIAIASLFKIHVNTLLRRDGVDGEQQALRNMLNNHCGCQCQLGELYDLLDPKNATLFADSRLNPPMVVDDAYGDILLIEKVQVNQKFSGNGFGRVLVQRIIDSHATAFDRVLVKPWPLQWSAYYNPMQPSVYDPKRGGDFDEDWNKVVNVWESMGFFNVIDRNNVHSVMWGRNQCHRQPDLYDAGCKCVMGMDQ